MIPRKTKLMRLFLHVSSNYHKKKAFKHSLKPRISKTNIYLIKKKIIFKGWLIHANTDPLTSTQDIINQSINQDIIYNTRSLKMIKNAFIRLLIKNMAPVMKFNLGNSFLMAMAWNSKFQIIWRHPQQKLTPINWS